MFPLYGGYKSWSRARIELVLGADNVDDGSAPKFTNPFEQTYNGEPLK